MLWLKEGGKGTRRWSCISSCGQTGGCTDATFFWPKAGTP